MNGTPKTSKTVLLVNPNWMLPPVAPLALDYLSSTLHLRGFSVDIIDLCLTAEWHHELDRYLQSRKPLAIGLTVRNTDDCYYLSRDFVLPKIKQLCEWIKQRSPRPVVLGGVGFSIAPANILRYLELDLGIWGDGEWAFCDLVERLSNGANILGTPGLVFRKDEAYVRTPPDLRNVLDLPLPSRGAVDNRRYLKEGGMVGIETKRGCNQGCIYCADPVAKGISLRLRPPQRIVEEIEQLLDLGIDSLHVCDSEFNLPYHHAVDVCREIIHRRLGEKIGWYAYLSPVPFTRQLASLMKKAGCQGINFGVDHGDDRMLKNLGRSFVAKDLHETAAICREYGITVMYDLLLGGPGENRETLCRGIDALKRINPSRVGISAGIRIYPGTRLAGIVREETVDNPNLSGEVTEGFLAPVFYLSHQIGEDIFPVVWRAIEGDERFFFGGQGEDATNYNYNDNSLLMEAIKNNYRGAFWDILRKLAEGVPPGHTKEGEDGRELEKTVS